MASASTMRAEQHNTSLTRKSAFLLVESSKMSREENEGRKMNDTTMPPPSQTTTATRIQSTAPARARQKVGLRKGFGLADWNRLLKNSKDLAQRKGQSLRNIKMGEVQKHNSVYDAWIVLKGKVYNISPYLQYHPGGESILKQVLGKDATALYEKYHRWVNEDSLIGKLLIGYLDDADSQNEDDSVSYLPQQMTRDGFAIPAPKPPKARR